MSNNPNHTSNYQKYFPGLIGQESALRELGFYLDGFQKNYTIPPLLLKGARGLGKTTLAHTLASQMPVSTDPTRTRDLIEINGATCKRLPGFVTDVIQNVVLANVNNGNETTLFIDEFHCVDRSIMNWLLSVIPVGSLMTTAHHGGTDIQFNWRLMSIITATTNPEKITVPLRDRFKQVDLIQYRNSDLVQLLVNKLPNINFDDEVLEQIKPTLRQSTRLAISRAQAIQQYCDIHNTVIFTLDDWKKLCYELSIYPLGLTRQELDTLLKLHQFGPQTLGTLARRLHLDIRAMSVDIEPYLLSHDLIRIENKRGITQNGINYLKGVSLI